MGDHKFAGPYWVRPTSSESADDLVFCLAEFESIGVLSNIASIPVWLYVNLSVLQKMRQYMRQWIKCSISWNVVETFEVSTLRAWKRDAKKDIGMKISEAVVKKGSIVIDFEQIWRCWGLWRPNNTTSPVNVGIVTLNIPISADVKLRIEIRMNICLSDFDNRVECFLPNNNIVISMLCVLSKVNYVVINKASRQKQKFNKIISLEEGSGAYTQLRITLSIIYHQIYWTGKLLDINYEWMYEIKV